GRAGVAVARRHRGAWPARVAHRVLGHGVETSRRNFRHSRRRHRSRVSSPRERDRAVALRLPYAGNGASLDAKGLPPGGRREDGEERWEFCDDKGIARRFWG